MEDRDIPGEVGVVKDVEQPAVEDRVEALAERVEAQHVEHLEDGLDSALSGLAPSDFNRARGDIDAEGDGTTAGGQDRVFTSPASRVEKSTGEYASVGEAEKCGLWATDVPRWRRVLVKLIPVVGRTGCGHVSILAQLGDPPRHGHAPLVPLCPAAPAAGTGAVSLCLGQPKPAQIGCARRIMTARSVRRASHMPPPDPLS
jgi:hypothetical protein